MAEKLNYDADGTHVFVKHSETGAVWASPVDYLPTAKLMGWEPAEQEDNPLEGLVDEQPDAFDPSDHTVAEVNEYLAAHPEDVDRVLAAEHSETGKNRSSINAPEEA